MSIKRLKKSILMEKVEFNQKSQSFRSLFDLLLIEFKFINKIFSRFKRFRRDDLKSGFH